MMSELSAQGSNQNRPFKPKIYQGKRKGQGRNNYGRYQDRYRSNSGDRYSTLPYTGRSQYRQNFREKSQYVQKYTGNFRRKILEKQNYRVQNEDIKVA